MNKATMEMILPGYETFVFKAVMDMKFESDDFLYILTTVPDDPYKGHGPMFRLTRDEAVILFDALAKELDMTYQEDH